MTALLYTLAAIGGASVACSIIVAVVALVVTHRENRAYRRQEAEYEARARRGDPNWWRHAA